MNNKVEKVIKKVSNSNFSVKKNYKFIRFFQKLTNFHFSDKKKFNDVVFHVKDRNVSCRIFDYNKDYKKNKIIIFIHGGGWVSGSVKTYTKTCLELSEKTNRIVIAIDYRLAPEYPFPAGFNDCYDVINLIMNSLSKFGFTKDDICLMGDSAGGNLVAAVVLKSCINKDFRIREQILLYPSLQSDYSNTTKYKSVIKNGKDYLLTQTQLQDYISLYVSSYKDLENKYVAPLKSKFYFKHPRSLIITADKDPLRDEGKIYATRLKLCFNKVKYLNLKGAIHGFFTQNINIKYKNKTYEEIIKFLGDNNE